VTFGADFRERRDRKFPRARPAARKPRRIRGEYQDALKIRLTAPPIDDRANEALCELLAARLKVPRAAVKIVAGERSRTKRVEIYGVTAQMIRGLLE